MSTPNQKSRPPAFQQKDQKQKAYRRQSRWFSWLGALGRLIEAIIKGMAFTLRALLRKNIGSKTFTIWTWIYGFIWTRIFLVWDFEFSTWSNLFESGPRPESVTEWLDLIKDYIQELIDNLKRIYTISITAVPQPLRSFMLLFYSYVFVLAAIVHRYSNDYKFRKRIPRDRFNRGDSFFFGWLKKRRLPFTSGKFKDHQIKIFIEPLSVILFGYLFFLYGDQQFGLFLMIGAACLVFEELKSHMEWRDYLETLADQEFYYKRLEAERAEFS
jgi:hypothetical protein